MKIGEFSKRNNITQDTIRHYIDMGLLVVEKHGCQYKFSDEDSRDIEEIVLLKQLDFSLTEIREILCFNRLEGDKTDEYRTFYLSLLERKKNHIMKEQQKFQVIDTLLSDRINELKMNGICKKKSLGFPISSIVILRCPYCTATLDFSDGTIERNMILEAVIQCECGYSAFIEDGIYFDKKVVNNKKEIPTKIEFLEATSSKYINFMYNGTTTLMDYIQNHGNEPKYILELDHCVGRFLMQYIDCLPTNCTYIVICQDKERIANTKRNLTLQHKHNNFIFFCCEVDQLPIVNSSMDIIIDHGMSKAYAKSTNKFLLDVVSPYLKQEGLLTGAYSHLGTKSKDFMNIPIEFRDYYCRNKMLEKLGDLDFIQLDVADIGPVIEKSQYIELKDKEQYLTLYVGKKKGSFAVISSEAQHEMKQKKNMIS